MISYPEIRPNCYNCNSKNTLFLEECTICDSFRTQLIWNLRYLCLDCDKITYVNYMIK